MKKAATPKSAASFQHILRTCFYCLADLIRL
jgi:hypothetical protein